MLKKEKDKITKVNLKNIKPSKVTDSYFGDGSIVLKKRKNSYVLYDRNNNKIIDNVKKFVFYNDQQYFDIDYKYSNIYPYIYVVGENSYIKIKLDPFNTYVAQLDDISDLIGVNMESEELDSVGGLVIEELGRIPEENEEVTDWKVYWKNEVDKLIEFAENRPKYIRQYLEENF